MIIAKIVCGGGGVRYHIIQSNLSRIRLSEDGLKHVLSGARAHESYLSIPSIYLTIYLLRFFFNPFIISPSAPNLHSITGFYFLHI